MTYQDALKDYIEVKDRIQEFKKLFPEGSLQFEFGGQMEINGATVIYGRAYAYRDREDIRPGIGTAWELVPGKSSFSRGSEMMVLETSCWGRAIAALGIATSKSVASREEVLAAKSRDPWDNPPDAQIKPVKADSSVFGVTQVHNPETGRKIPEKGPTVSNMARPASDKQIGFLKRLFNDAWKSVGYEGEPGEDDLVAFVNDIAKTNYSSVPEFTSRTVSEILDQQNLMDKLVMDWQKDSRLWASDAF